MATNVYLSVFTAKCGKSQISPIYELHWQRYHSWNREVPEKSDFISECYVLPSTLYELTD